MDRSPARRAAVYARISVVSDESVSIERQVEAAEQYAAARGWQIVAAFTDQGVSATSNRPEVRPGWRALMTSRENFDVVIVWKVDRLARRIADFWETYRALDASGRSLASVSDNLDMTTTVGQIVAGVIAGFAQMEAEAISARVADARRVLIKSGRVVGGSLPYGWCSVPNPDGPGYVLAWDPDRIDFVRAMVDRTVAGASIYSTAHWLDEVRAPAPLASQKNRKAAGWSYNTVERILRNPVLAGMTPFNPGNASKDRGVNVLRDADGLPMVAQSLAIMSVSDWRRMVKALDERGSAQTRPVGLRAKTSPLLSGLLYCGEHLLEDGRGTRMHRGTVQGRAAYYCPTCFQSVSNFEELLVDEFLRQKGEQVRWSLVEDVYEGGAALLPEIEHNLAELTELLQTTDDDAVASGLVAQIGNLRAMRRQARAVATKVVQRWARQPQDFGQDWAEAVTVEERRAILGDAIERVWVLRGRPGRRTNAQLLARLVIEWRLPDHLGPIEVPDDATLAAWSD